MSNSCDNDCASCGSDCADRRKTDFHEPPHALSRIRSIVGVVSGKGGVGKSLVTSLLAVLCQRAGLQTGILDADVTGPSIPRAFGLAEKAMASEEGVFPVLTKTGIRVMSLNLLLPNETDPVVWRGPVIAGTVRQFWTDVIWGDIDMLFIDMPPGTGDVPLTVFQTIPVDGVVVVTSPQELVGMIVEKAVNMAGMMQIPVLGLVENMGFLTCPDCGREIRPFGESRADALALKHGILKTASLPIDPKFAAACDTGMIELFEGRWLDGMAEMLEKRVKSKQ